MKKFKLVLILLLFCLSAFAQKKKARAQISVPTKEYGDVLEKRMDCLFRNKFTNTERLKFFPFNTNTKVVLISFEWPEPKDEIIITESDVKDHIQHQPDTIPALDTKEKRQKFYQSITKETKVLSPNEINMLTNTLYNIGYKSKESYHGILLAETRYSCYEPRNAILFLDENGLLAEYIELCFKCHQRRISSEKIKLGEFCNQKYELLQSIFKSVGIKYVKLEKALNDE